MTLLMRRALHVAISTSLALTLAACGGDDDHPVATPPPGHTAPPDTPSPPAPTLRCAP